MIILRFASLSTNAMLGTHEVDSNVTAEHCEGAVPVEKPGQWSEGRSGVWNWLKGTDKSLLAGGTGFGGTAPRWCAIGWNAVLDTGVTEQAQFTAANLHQTGLVHGWPTLSYSEKRYILVYFILFHSLLCKPWNWIFLVNYFWIQFHFK
jgi:hypothetical protein